MNKDPKKRIALKEADIRLKKIEKKYCEGGESLEEE